MRGIVLKWEGEYVSGSNERGYVYTERLDEAKVFPDVTALVHFVDDVMFIAGQMGGGMHNTGLVPVGVVTERRREVSLREVV